MFDGTIILYYSFFSEKKYFQVESNKYLNKIKSWPFIDSSFNDYFINIFSKYTEIKSIPHEFLSPETFNYDDELCNCIFSIETKLNFKEYKYLNIIKCGYKINGLNHKEIQDLSKLKSEDLFEKIVELNIPELRDKSGQIKKQLFAQKLKSQVILLDRNKLSFLERKYVLLDLALDREKGTSKRTIETEEPQRNAHSKSYIQALLNNSLIDQYQDWSTIITQKKIITIYDNDNSDNLLNNSVQFGLIYAQKIIVSELITCLNLWVNENKFEYNFELSKYYMHISRNLDFKIISTKYLYNEYSKILDYNLKINDEKEIINNKLKEIENILEKEKNQTSNLLLFAIAILQILTVFIDEIRNEAVEALRLNKTNVSHFILVTFVIICGIIIYLFLKRRKI